MAIGTLIIFLVVCAVWLGVELLNILRSVEVVSYEPVLVGQNYRCPTCKAFWYMRDEEVHFKGCIVPIVRSNAPKLRRGSSQV